MSYSGTTNSRQPETYAELGAAVAFITPELTGARARLGRQGLELTLPNLSGARGHYVFAPSEIAQYCSPCLHDRQIAAALAGLAEVSPASLREVVRGVAAAGFAGRAAAAAARIAQEATRKAVMATQYTILRELVRQLDAARPNIGVQSGAKAAIAALALCTGCPAADIIQAIERISHLLAPIGIGDACGCLPAILLDIRAVLDRVAPQAALITGRQARAAALILSAGTETLALAPLALDQAAGLLYDVPALLARAVHDPAGLADVPRRADWLLDGWAKTCRIWTMAKPGRSAAALAEMAMTVPVIPVEATAWFGLPAREPERQPMRAEVLGFADWRSDGLAQDLAARNETIRALAA